MSFWFLDGEYSLNARLLGLCQLLQDCCLKQKDNGKALESL